MAGPTEIRLHEALAQVVDAIHQRCQTATDPGGLLEGIRDVVKGGRSRVRPDPPYLWIAVAAGTATDARAMHETWELAVMLTAFVHSEEPEDGWLDAFGWAARARSVTLADRQLGLGFVEDVQSAELGALGRFAPSRKFGAFARVNVRLALVEPPI